jgi:hypothetical protein
MHYHRDAQIRVFTAYRTDYLKAAQVRAEQEQAFAAGKHAAQHVFSMNFDIEQVKTAVEQVDAVMNGGGKGEKMPVPISPSRGAVQRPPEIIAGRVAAGRREQQKIHRDKV